MPIYDYTCESCGRTIEVVHGVNGSGPKACEVCGGSMRKLMSTPAIVFKGSGWAKKDARASRGGSTAGKASSQRAADAEGGSSTPAPTTGGDASGGSGSRSSGSGSSDGGSSGSGSSGGGSSGSDASTTD